MEPTPPPAKKKFERTEPMEATPPPPKDLPKENLTEPNLWNLTSSSPKEKKRTELVEPNPPPAWKWNHLSFWRFFPLFYSHICLIWGEFLCWGQLRSHRLSFFLTPRIIQWPYTDTPKHYISVSRKRGQRKGATSKKVKNRQNVNNIFDTFRQFSRKAKNVKDRQKVSKIFSTLFDNFRAAAVFRPLLGGSDTL